MPPELASIEATLAGPATDGIGYDDQVVSAVGRRRSAVVIALVGMGFEARIAAGAGICVVRRQSAEKLAAVVESAVRQGCRGIVSFGVAGGLAPHLRPGDWIVGSSIVKAHARHATDEAWSQRLLNIIPEARHAPMAGADVPIHSPAAKRELHASTGAAVVDMESHIVAEIAATYRLALAAVRVVVDPAHRLIPPAALVGMRADGGVDKLAILRALLAHPSQTSALARLAFDAMIAHTEMVRVRRLLGPDFGLTDSPAGAIAGYVAGGAVAG